MSDVKMLERQVAQALERDDRLRVEQLGRQLLHAQPKNPWGLTALSKGAFDRGNHEDAQRLMEQALAQDRREPRFYCYLGTVRAARGRLREAMMCFDKALKLKPDDLLAISGKADVFERQGKISRARAVIEPAIRSGSITGKMLAAYARLLLSEKDYETLTRVVEPHCNSPQLEESVRRALHLICGRARHGQKNHARAWALLQAGNALHTSSVNQSAAKAGFDQIMKTFSVEAWPDLPRADNDDETPVFLIGMPRSGTTLVEQTVHAHPRGHGAGELPALGIVLDSMPDRFGCRPFPEGVGDLDRSQMSELADAYLDRLKSHAPRAERIVDKALQYPRIAMIRLLFPKARILHVRRHPMDSGLSCYMNNLDAVQHPYSSRLEDIGFQYGQYLRCMDHASENLDIEMLEVRYEAFISDREAQTHRLIEFLGLPWNDRCLRSHEAKRDVATISYNQVNQPIYTSAMNRWKTYETQLAPLRHALGTIVEEYEATMEGAR